MLPIASSRQWLFSPCGLTEVYELPTLVKDLPIDETLQVN